MRRAAVAVAVAAAVCALAPVAAAESGAQVRALAARAADGDAAALEQLRAVREVDGRAVDLSTALGDATGRELDTRLRMLAADTPASAAVTDPRASAASILDESRFRGSDVPQPLHGVLDWLGDRLRTLARPVRWLAGLNSEGVPVGEVLVAALVVLAAGAVAWLIARRRVGASVNLAERRARERGGDPEELEREADEAERRGDLGSAMRLRFRAGLLRLTQTGAIPADERTNGELRPLLDQQAFDRLATGLDAVAYGGRVPTPGDVDAARRDWRDVLSRSSTS